MHWQINSYQPGQVGEEDLYKEDWLEKPSTLMQEILVVVDGGIMMEKINFQNMTYQLWNLGNLSDLH